jgi:hypothetical protein
MFVQLPFGHTEVRVDTRNPRKLAATSALDVIRRVRREKS